MHSSKQWNLAFMTLNSWFFLQAIDAWKQVDKIGGMYYQIK